MMASGSANCAISQVRRSAMIGLWSQSGLLTTCARADFAHSLNLRTSAARSVAFCRSRRREQLLHRRDQVVEPVADVADERHLGEHDVAHAAVSMRMSMNFGPRGTIGAGPLCWNLLPTLMIDVGALRVVQRVESCCRRDCRPRADASPGSWRRAGAPASPACRAARRASPPWRPPWPCRSRRRRPSAASAPRPGASRRARPRRDWAAPACADRPAPAR